LIKETVEMMIPFITLDSKVTMNSDSVGWRITSLTNLSVRSGNKGHNIIRFSLENTHKIQVYRRQLLRRINNRKRSGREVL